jgi:hypothetical protein
MARVKKRTNDGRRQRARRQLTRRQLETLIEEAIVDAYGESEQRVGFLTICRRSISLTRVFTPDPSSRIYRFNLPGDLLQVFQRISLSTSGSVPKRTRTYLARVVTRIAAS